MPHIAFLHRIRQLFGTSSPHVDVLAEALADGRLKQPAQPMTDQELARAIREFQNAPPSEATLKRLRERLDGINKAGS
ncbi:hypothetical protein ACQR1W_23090 [Bradyrhizobium sp. HKCCYLS1011]|uniref:hypothetical protein n=1 Tax=Bradyrhizobium sp. HKCCYLS1011 TaxID=3420733 RepID=UPI003EBA2B7C